MDRYSEGEQGMPLSFSGLTNWGLSYGAQMLAAAGGAAFLLLLLQTRSGPAMDTAWAPQLHRISINFTNRRRGSWRPAHLRPHRALLRFVMLASKSTFLFFGATTVCVPPRVRGSSFPPGEAALQGRASQAWKGPFCFKHKP